MLFKPLTNMFGSKKSSVESTADYQQWRQVIFAVKPEEAGVSSSEADRVYGVVMDVGVIGQQRSIHWALSLSAFGTGEASFRPTVGGGVIGLGSNSQVGQVAEEIVQLAQRLWLETQPTQDVVLPEPGVVQFFFLTTGGLRVFKGQVDKVQQSAHPFEPLLNRFGFIRQFADQLVAAEQTRADP
jgi:hypothetical protein